MNWVTATDQLSLVFAALADPTRRAILAELTVGDLLDGHGVEVQPLAAPLLDGDHEVGVGEDSEVLHHPEPAHPVLERLAQLADGPAVAVEEEVEDLPPGGVGERPEDGVLGVHAAIICDRMVTYQERDVTRYRSSSISRLQ